VEAEAGRYGFQGQLGLVFETCLKKTKTNKKRELGSK
jgi:hypothetical protein